MKRSFRTGIGFGMTSAIITTLGLMVGLTAGTHSRLAVIGGILTIAIADAFSDALGIHIAEESENRHSEREIWESTFSTFLSKFVFAMIFILPLLVLPLGISVPVNIVLGLSFLGIFSYYIGIEQKTNPWKPVVEHVLIALMVIILAHVLGMWISVTFA